MDAVIIFKVELGIERVARAAQGPPSLLSRAPQCSPRPRPTLLAPLHTQELVCTPAVQGVLVGRENPRAPHPSHPAAGFTTFPRRSRLWVVTSRSSSRKGLLKWA